MKSWRDYFDLTTYMKGMCADSDSDGSPGKAGGFRRNVSRSKRRERDRYAAPWAP